MTAYKWKCKNFSCEVQYTGSRDGIFFKTQMTAFCDEVMQDFEDEIFDTTNGTNFSTYVTRMNTIYESNGCTPKQFCSSNTFTTSMFAWLQSMFIIEKTLLVVWNCDFNIIQISVDKIAAGKRAGTATATTIPI